MTKETTTCEHCEETGCSARDRRDGESREEFESRQALAARMCKIRNKLVVLSGKGGVGKSTVAINLAVALARAGMRVGLLDADIHGPSVPKMLRLEDVQIQCADQVMFPARACGPGFGLGVISIGLFLRGPQDAVIWRGPMKYNAIKQLLRDVEWGELDYLIVDCPPGTGDEPLAVVQLIHQPDGALVVTTPQDLAVADVRRSIGFCRQLDVPVVGVVENMSGFVCPGCGERSEIFGSGGGEMLAAELGIPFLGKIPIDGQVVLAGDSGQPFTVSDPHSDTSRAFGRVVRKVLEPELDEGQERIEKRKPDGSEEDMMKIAIPVAQGSLCQHFGHCEQFALFDVDRDQKKIIDKQFLTPPPHEPGVLPGWLKEQGADMVIAGGMGVRAQGLFTSSGVKVLVGAPAAPPETVVQDFLDGTLRTGENVCDH